MSTSQTPNYGLHQWAGEDQFKRTDFNEDNAKLDAALHGLRSDLTAQSAALDAKATQSALTALTATVNTKANQTSLDALTTKVNAKAEQSALNALTSTVNTKASQSALNALTTKVNAKAEQSALNALSATVGGKGNCRIVTGSYTGTGVYGKENPKSLTFDGKPLVLFISNDGYFLSALYGIPSAQITSYSFVFSAIMTWSGNSVSWYANTEHAHMNQKGMTYDYVALMQA